MKAKEIALPYEKLIKELDYNPDTGIFYRKKTLGKRYKSGDIAGTKSKHGYIIIFVDGHTYMAHRLAWVYVMRDWPTEIDHINHIRDDNRFANLRQVTRLENSRNAKKSKKNTSGVTGVHWQKARNLWAAYITNNGNKVHLGFYKNKFDAICSRKSAENVYNFHENHGQ